MSQTNTIGTIKHFPWETAYNERNLSINPSHFILSDILPFVHNKCFVYILCFLAKYLFLIGWEMIEEKKDFFSFQLGFWKVGTA